jgi:hypothetical protein
MEWGHDALRLARHQPITQANKDSSVDPSLADPLAQGQDEEACFRMRRALN